MLINKEFEKLVSPLSTIEYLQLEQNIIAEGCRDALVVWKEENTLLDGHNRYVICQNNAIEFDIIEISLPDRSAAMLWILSNQLGRRNLTDEQRTYYLGARYELEKLGHGGDRASHHNDDLKTKDRIANELYIGSATVERAAKYKQSVDRIAEHSDELKDSILAGDTETTKKDIMQFGAVQRDNPELGKLAVDELLAGNATGFKQAIYNGKKNHQLIHQSKSNEWYTPSEYIEAARLVMGSIDLDPASCEYANETVMAGEYFNKEDDGLSQSWFGNIWLNPPYGRVGGNDSNQSLWSNTLIER
jgi:hypothetical protein